MTTHALQQPTGTLTIVATTIEEVMSQFQDRRLAEAGYVIAGPARRQNFALKDEPLFAGASMVAATFVRRA